MQGSGEIDSGYTRSAAIDHNEVIRDALKQRECLASRPYSVRDPSSFLQQLNHGIAEYDGFFDHKHTTKIQSIDIYRENILKIMKSSLVDISN
jgi:hypothetical protein